MDWWVDHGRERDRFFSPLSSQSLVSAVLLAHRPPAPAPSTPSSSLWTRPMTQAELVSASSSARAAFGRAFDAYIDHGFPSDDVRPLSCRGVDTQGGVALTLLDALTTALTLNDTARLSPAVLWAAGEGGPLADVASARGAPNRASLTFDVPARVHTFELTIRALGALVSTHTFLTRSPRAVPGYGGGLLRAAVDLADRLLPAFDTLTGLPLSWVNLSSGMVPNDTRITCTACAGTLTLEFSALSALTGNDSYRRAAAHAAAAVSAAASPTTGLVGNTLHVDTGAWTRRDSGVGAGIDSYVEYLLKSFLLTGDEKSLISFVSIYAAIMRHLTPPKPPSPGHHRPSWRVDGADMNTGARASPWISSLGAFFPGLQALAGQRADAAAAHADWAAAWARFGGLPESLDVGGTTRHPGAAAYPLRPELAESSYALHAATNGHPVYRAAGAMVAKTLEARCKAPCGFASLADVASGAQEDTMESFFLAETVKYLWLLFTPGAEGLLDAAVLTTEGHPLPPLPRADGTPDPPPPTVASNSTCAFLCTPPPSDDWAAGVAARVGAVMPLLAPTGAEVALLRSRRCAACVAVDDAMDRVRADVAAADAAAAAAARPLAQVVCRLKVVGSDGESDAEDSDAKAVVVSGGGLACASLERVPPSDVPLAFADVPRDAIVVQLMPRGEGDAAPPAPAPQEGTCGDDSSPSDAPSDGGDAVTQLHVTATGSKGEALIDLTLTGTAAGFGPRLAPGSPACAPSVTPCTVGGRLVAADPADACAPLVRAPPSGAVVAVNRGACSFELKVFHVAAAGGGAVVVLSDTDDDFVMAPAEDKEEDADGSAPLVPSLLLARPAADTLRSALAAAGDAVTHASLRPAPETPSPSSSPSAVTIVLPPRTARWVAARVPGGDARPALAGLLPALVTSPELKQLLRLE